MKTNKTPIQELIDYMHNHRMDMREEYGLIFVTLRDVEIMLEKEKQFAFDCFQAGNRFGMDVCGSFDCGQHPTKPDFDEFYSQYVPQHNK